ncbi:putative general secretory pathway protein E [Aedoeadaptatus nemausensis]|uniref:Putative general secretory pathway protein E n=1 Tax=Aedoeadaptatus nemausensis TaxID=2582829 RepID=A0A6V6Y0L9_9FIRM|nr:GspE/PulE family protein [Peptoniphilus nemausensis]CAC9924749.1 putative general secretory pathway protein E [Peptoniphilus nemausensis]
MKKNDGFSLASKFDIEFLGEKDGIAYFRSDDSSAEMRDDLTDALAQEVVLVKSTEGNPLDFKVNRSESPLDAVALSEQILRDGILKCCSDVHIEPADDHWRVRMRRNGTLFLYGEYENERYSEFITRIKLMSQMDIGERRRPQDGRFSMTLDGKYVDVRVSSVPVKGREKLVLRLLDREGLDYTPEGIGLKGKQLEEVLKLLRQPLGLVLICGPTGSGKTTTLYTFLQLLNKVERNILTIEDPVEYAIDGINQMQVNQKANITFTTGLESMLRQDPEVMMVGEIRSKETAEIALRSSITGHLIFSTLHTTDSPSAMIRLMDMGVEPYMLSAGVIGVISQRLVRTLCPECKRKVETHDDYFDIKGETYKPIGCSYCDNGYVGREAIFEILTLSESLRALIKPGVTLDMLRREAEKEGMVPLKDSLREKIKEGTISMDEAYRTIMTL